MSGAQVLGHGIHRDSDVKPMNVNLTLAAALAALCALPAVAADVDVSVEVVSCATTLDPITTPPSLEPRVTVDDCEVSAHTHSGPQAGCPEVGPFAWLRPYVHLDSDCDLTIRY
jgi:hypothetical protein